MEIRKLILSALLALASVTAFAAEAPPAADDPALEKRAMGLAEVLRCLVCQNQSLADSHAELAVDLRNQIREKMKAGMSDEQIVDYMVNRYGDFVLYKPPVRRTTWLLWFGPFVLMVGGVWLLFRKLKARSKSGAPAPLDDAAQAKARALLEGREEAR